MPTVAFALNIDYVKKLDERVRVLGMTKSEYLRKMLIAILDVEEE